MRHGIDELLQRRQQLRIEHFDRFSTAALAPLLHQSFDASPTSDFIAPQRDGADGKARRPRDQRDPSAPNRLRLRSSPQAPHPLLHRPFALGKFALDRLLKSHPNGRLHPAKPVDPFGSIYFYARPKRTYRNPHAARRPALSVRSNVLRERRHPSLRQLGSRSTR